MGPPVVLSPVARRSRAATAIELAACRLYGLAGYSGRIPSFKSFTTGFSQGRNNGTVIVFPNADKPSSRQDERTSDVRKRHSVIVESRNL